MRFYLKMRKPLTYAALNRFNCMHNFFARSELEQAKKDARELTVQEAVAKNAFEKIAKAGRDKVENDNFDLTLKVVFIKNCHFSL
jgi:hypothetical protein